MLSVLLVDDHEGFINAAVRHLRRLDWIEIAGSASNGIEAIAQCEALRPDVVLMDLAMPLLEKLAGRTGTGAPVGAGE